MADIPLRILMSATGGSGIVSALSSIGSALGNGGLGGIMLGVTAAVGAAAIGVGVAATKMAGDYQQSMNKVQALTGSSNQQMQQYDSSLKSLAVNAGVAPKALSEGLYNVISAGYSGASAMNVLTLATEDSKIGMTDATTTTNALTNVMANFKIGAGQANIVNGEMLQTVTMGKATFSQYASNITKAASTSAQFGQSMETMNAAWATLTASGISAGMATTDYDASLKVMDGNVGKVADSLHKNGIAFDQTKFSSMSYGQQVVYMNNALQQARDKHVAITGATQQASQAISTIAGHIGMYNNDLSQLSNKQEMANKTQQAWSVTQNGFNQQMSRVNAAGQVLMITIGQALLPALTKIAAAVAPIISNFTVWLTKSGALQNGVSVLSNGIVSAINIIGRLVSIGSSVVGFFQHNQLAMDGLKAVLIGLGVGILAFVATTIPAMVAAFVTWAIAAGAAAIATLAAAAPFILIGAVVAVVVVGIILAIQHWGQISAWLQGIWSATLNFIKGLWGGLGAWFQGIWANIQGAFSSVGSWFQTQFTNAVNGVKNVFGSIGAFFSGIWSGIQNTFSNVGGWFQQKFGQAKTGAQNGWSGVNSFFQTSGAALQQIWTNTVNGIVGAFSWLYNHNYYFKNLVDNIQAWMLALGTWMISTWNNLVSTVTGLWSRLTGFATSIFNTVSGAIRTAISAVVSWVQSAWSNSINFISAQWSRLTGFASSIFNQVASTIRSVFSAVVSYIQSLWNGDVAFIQAVWSRLIGIASSVFNSVYSTISGIVANIINWFQSQLSRMGGLAQNAWNSVVSVFSGAWGAISGTLSGLYSNISSWFTGLASDALSWGENIINSIASGITNAAGAVTNAVSGVAQNIKNFLGFHSPAAMGPAGPGEADVWMPNLMRLLSSSMISSLPTLQSAVTTTASVIAGGLSGVRPSVSGTGTGISPSGLPSSSLLGGSSTPAASASTNQNITLQLQIYAQQVDASEMDRIAQYAVTYFGDQIRAQYGTV